MGINSLPNQILGNRPRSIPGLQRCLSQCLNRQHIGLPKGHTIVRKVMLLAKILNQGRDLPQMAAREPGKQMVLHLKLQATMKPVHPRRTAHIKSPISLLLKPIITTWRTKVNFGREMV